MPLRWPLPKATPLVLLVEDNEVSSEALVSYLEFLDCRVVVARSGVEALEQATAHLPDLILMDIQLPGMDGLEVTRRLRLDSRFVVTPIIAVTVGHAWRSRSAAWRRAPPSTSASR